MQKEPRRVKLHLLVCWFCSSQGDSVITQTERGSKEAQPCFHELVIYL